MTYMWNQQILSHVLQCVVAAYCNVGCSELLLLQRVASHMFDMLLHMRESCCMCCSVLQCVFGMCVAVCCSVLQCVAVCCSVLRRVCVTCYRIWVSHSESFAVFCYVLQCVAVCCSVLQCVAVCCSVLQCVTACCSVLQRVASCMCDVLSHMSES